MQAIQLETHIQNDGKITLPEIYREWYGKTVQLVLLESSLSEQETYSAFDIYDKLDLGEGGYTQASSANVKQGIKDIKCFEVIG
ncbi:MAG: hypothetical protein WCI11_16515 [Candidatus Methylumidiphilus sp.]